MPSTAPLSAPLSKTPSPVPLYHGFELTFLPSRRGKWQEWRRHEEAEVMAAAFNQALQWSTPARTLGLKRGLVSSPPIRAQADIFRSVALSAHPQPHDAWCVEVHNEPLSGVEVARVGGVTWNALNEVYRIARSLGLHPCVVKERRGRRKNTLVEYPNGGGHQHISLDIWAEGSNYIPKLYALERSVCIDYANLPVLRWLFSQWLDNDNSALALDAYHLRNIVKALHKATPPQRRGWEETGLDAYAHDRALLCHSIKQRIAYTGKPARPTYEFRFFDMPRSVAELELHTRFLDAWLGHHISRIDEEEGLRGIPHCTLTLAQFTRMARDAGYAKATIEQFFGKIGLDAQIWIDAFWQRGYLTRQRYGKMI